MTLIFFLLQVNPELWHSCGCQLTQDQSFLADLEYLMTLSPTWTMCSPTPPQLLRNSPRKVRKTQLSTWHHNTYELKSDWASNGCHWEAVSMKELTLKQSLGGLYGSETSTCIPGPWVSHSNIVLSPWSLSLRLSVVSMLRLVDVYFWLARC